MKWRIYVHAPEHSRCERRDTSTWQLRRVGGWVYVCARRGRYSRWQKKELRVDDITCVVAFLDRKRKTVVTTDPWGNQLSVESRSVSPPVSRR